MKAIWNNKIIAQSEETIIVEGNHYFPHKAINKEYFKESETVSSCYWKGKASYFHVEVDGKTNKDAAWYYATPLEKATHIANYVAFWKGVEVVN